MGALLFAPGSDLRFASQVHKGDRALDAAPILPNGAGRDTVSTASAFPKSASVTVPPEMQLGRENGLVSVCTKEMKAQRCDQTWDGSVSYKGGKRLQPSLLHPPPSHLCSTEPAWGWGQSHGVCTAVVRLVVCRWEVQPKVGLVQGAHAMVPSLTSRCPATSHLGFLPGWLWATEAFLWVGIPSFLRVGNYDSGFGG